MSLLSSNERVLFAMTGAGSAMEDGAADTVLLAELIDAEPVVFLGCTVAELISVTLLSVALSLPLCGGLGWLLGGAVTALGAVGIGALAAAWGGAQLLCRIKQGKPQHYYQQCLDVALARAGLLSRPVTRSGYWGLGRQPMRR